MKNILYAIFIMIFTTGFTIPDNCEYRQLSPDELRTMRRVVAKVNRVAWYDVNTTDRYYVPTDETPGWSPIEKHIVKFESMPKVVFVVLHEYFLGRYENGELIEWTNVLAGKTTQRGIFRVLEKDKDHYSKSYKTSDGRPTPMPNALRIYDTVWIHGGDSYKPKHISHDCINVVNDYASDLFDWAEVGTIVIIVD